MSDEDLTALPVRGEDDGVPEEEEVRVFVEGLDDMPEPETPEENQIPSEYRNLTKAQLVEKIQKNQEELVKAGDSSAAIRQAIGELGEVMRPVVQPVVNPVQQTPSESDEDYEERLKNDFLDHPKKALDEYLGKSVGPLVNSVASGTMQMARELIRVQKGPDTFDRYSPEIDQIVSGVPVSDRISKPREVYENAYNQVMAGHLDELISVRVAEEVAKLSSGAGTKESSSPGIRAPYGASQVRPAARVRNVTLNAAERVQADQKGLDYDTYARLYK